MKRTSINQKQIKYLPKFNIDVESGNKINSRDLIGNYSLLLFLDDRDDNDMVFLSSLVDYIDKYNVNTVAFVRKKNNALLKNLNSNSKIQTVELNNSNLSNSLNSQYGEYRLYDKKGKLFYAGKTTDAYFGRGAVSYHLNKLIREKYFNIDLFVDINKKLADIDYLKQLVQLLKENDKKYYLISMMTSLCDACGSGLILTYLNRINTKFNNNVFVATILKNDFTQKEISSLKSQSRIKYPVFLADDVLDAKWEELINEYRENDITDIVILADKNTIILKLLDNSCNCVTKFFFEVEKLLSNI